MKENGLPDFPPPGKPVVQHKTDVNRQKRRALIKAVGARQFKKLYRKTP